MRNWPKSTFFIHSWSFRVARNAGITEVLLVARTLISFLSMSVALYHTFLAAITILKKGFSRPM
uniref:Uncharacterized protein n=1 Tax=uncultured marine virus TaxID=186617 RepID=A0A0F7L650_9VIRU|nr:hypothetical protein [uncultured marine virus]